MRPDRLLLMMIAAFAMATFANAQRDPARYHRALLPFHASVSAGDGVWGVSWWIHNEGDRAADVFPMALGGGLPPPPHLAEFVFIPAYPAVRPHSTLRAFASDALPSPFVPPFVPVRTNGVGAFLYVENDAMPNIAIAGTVGWRSLGSRPPLTPLRAVPARAFLAGTHNIVGVPYMAGARYDLRVYALPETVTSPAVTVRVYDVQAPTFDSDGDAHVHTRTVDLISPQASLWPCFMPCEVPSVALVPAAIQVFNLFEPNRDPRYPYPQTFRVEIEPQSKDLRWWAIVSAMEQSTRSVTLFQPSF